MRIVSLNLPPYHVFTLEEIEDATDNFDAANLVAEVSQAQVKSEISVFEADMTWL